MENTNLDLKKSIDPESPKGMLGLVKDLVAIANTGGGAVAIGRTETETPGIDQALVEQLDSARVMDQVNKFIAPATASIGHSVTSVSPGRVVVELKIAPADKPPFVFNKDGQYTKSGRTRNVFRGGDIYVRRGSQSVRAGHEDIVKFLERAEEQGRRKALGQLKELTNELARLPEGSAPLLMAATPTGELHGTPQMLVDVVIHRRLRGDSSAMLDARTLLRIFLERRAFEITLERRDMLIRSALRRRPTLFFWLLDGVDREQIERILLSTLDDEDRDKSDASHSILELGALFASDGALETIVRRMGQSRYAHFRRTAAGWQGRDREQQKFHSLADSVTVNGVAGEDLSDEELIAAAEDFARHILSNPRARTANRLMPNIGRLLLRRRLQSPSQFGNQMLNQI